MNKSLKVLDLSYN